MLFTTCNKFAHPTLKLQICRAIGGWKGAFIINGVIFFTILIAGVGFGMYSAVKVCTRVRQSFRSCLVHVHTQPPPPAMRGRC